MSLQTIQEVLRDAYDYFIVPKAMLDTPVQLSEMIKQDKNGNDIAGEYYTLNEVQNALGNQFTFLPIINPDFVGFRWMIDWDRTESTIIQYLEDNGLVDMRASSTEFKKKAQEIDFVNLVGNEYGIFSKLAFKKISKPAQTM